MSGSGMFRSYVVVDLVRNPRRTLSTMVGVVLGIGLFCGVLFFVDGLSASMTQRAVAPLPIDMQRIVTERAGAALHFTETVVADGEQWVVALELTNPGPTDANEVTVRSVPAAGLIYVAGSAEIDGSPVPDADGNPFARGPARAGRNIETVTPGRTVRVTFRLETGAGPGPAPAAANAGADADPGADPDADPGADPDADPGTDADPDTGADAGADPGADADPDADPDAVVRSSYSTRESVQPIAANRPPPVEVDELARRIAELPGVARAAPLSIADLGLDAVNHRGQTAAGPAKIFGFDSAYAGHDTSIEIVEGSLADGAALSAEAAAALGVAIGDRVTIDLPDGSTLDLEVTGIADLSRSRSLFSSRRGGDLETFVYVPNAVVVSPERFADVVFPAFERAAADESNGRLKAPPIREVDVTLARGLLDADPATAAGQTRALAGEVMAVAAHQDYLLDNITNTLTVAADDAEVAKRLFVFLGLPGGLLAAMLAAYAGNVLAEAQRREQAVLRIRGASRRHLLRMLAARTALLTAVGAVLGVAAGYLVAATILGRASLARASTASLATSAIVGTVVGFAATGAALYLTGRRSIDREINEDRSALVSRPPLWRRFGLDVVAVAVVASGTVWALAADAFAGEPGSVYFGRSVRPNLALLVLPVAVWVAGSLLVARLTGVVLARVRPASSAHLGPLTMALLRRSIGRRPWPIGSAAIVASLIVALATSLAGFTASYDRAKIDDARYANGADLRITPSPTATRPYWPADAGLFETPSIDRATPVVYGLSNVILRSARTSDPANLAAIDPATYAEVAPLDPGLAARLDLLGAGAGAGGGAVLLSEDMAGFLKVEVGDRLQVLLARATPEQAGVDLTVVGLYPRLPGFPEGADAVIDLDGHLAAVPTKAPDFFLASPVGDDEASLARAVAELRAGPAGIDGLQIDTRASTLDRNQSSLAALNIAGLVDLDTGFSLAMAVVAIGVFVFGLLLQRRREFVTLRALGLAPGTIRLLITAEAAVAAAAGAAGGLLVGGAMGFYFVAVLRPLFVLDPGYVLPPGAVGPPVLLVAVATVVAALVGSRLVNSLEPTELLRDE